ncbi:HisA/HisF-related TIM barrel protein [Methylobacterium brachythecii]|uniref:Nickel transporter n=1 Tax=Methylobacterium brachythecii TaxID=1176177 RepID=A0A7W6AG04_9HYPH|nr:HisA/HisF-related TIM barrel protein [Methylobacterium brachythecii]MBB3902607.1 phosphoribosylformimino-5-aminoimidazole carboxamide ribotide isomerase [Methylobacterium brachythecii]GLS42451.1 nickel transporter [Methylobacterium brachythecii]
MTFRVIPVIDLRGGLVVRARAGDRDAYAPIRTPLASGSAPADVARGLLATCPAEILYVADLDAIVDGRAPDLASLRAIRAACPSVDLWLDAGFSTMAAVGAFLAEGLGRPVLGSESQADSRLVRALGDRAVLSLDSRAGATLGPGELHEDPSCWPQDVIVMTLSRIGVSDGPDVTALSRVALSAPTRRIYAAGGVRGPDDLRALREIGVAGALVASAIHDGKLRR